MVTDVGDSARIAREFGVVVPPRDAAALSLTQQVREHVIKSFGQQALINATVEAVGTSVDWIWLA